MMPIPHQEPPRGAPIGGDRLLCLEDVQAITGLCDVTASQVMDETGHAITLHRKKLLFESDFIAFLRSKEVTACA